MLSADPSAMLTVRDLHAYYGNIHALKGLDLIIRKGEFVAILGPNGAGKSTLLKTIIGVLDARAGAILFEGRDIAGLTPTKRIHLGLSIIPEGRQLFADMTVRENIILGAYARLGLTIPRGVDSLMAWILDMFPRLRERQHQLAGTLSGGEAQMLAIGRALMTKPRLLLCDELSIGLSPALVREVLQTLARLHQEGMSIMLADQNALATLRIANRGYILDTGVIVTAGTSEELLKDKALHATYLGAPG